MVVLDTNHVSELFYRSAAGERVLERLLSSQMEAVTTAVCVEENLRGWLAVIRRNSDVRLQIPAYARLIQQVELFAAWLVLPWDVEAADHFERLKHLRQKIGTQDLKIACIALAHDATLLSRNVQDFVVVPGLQVENWLD
jgi:tRNA(fMet)-specific endonuclease VapC